MIRRIFKYTLQEYGSAIVPLPMGAVVLHVDEQQGALQMWCMVAPEQPHETRRFAVIFTGEDEVPPLARYVGSAVSHGGNIVRHVFEEHVLQQLTAEVKHD